MSSDRNAQHCHHLLSGPLEFQTQGFYTQKMELSDTQRLKSPAAIPVKNFLRSSLHPHTRITSTFLRRCHPHIRHPLGCHISCPLAMGNTETLVHIGCWSWGRRLPRRSGKVPQRCREHNEGLFVEQLFFYTTLACVKLSLLFFFRRVGWYMTKLRVAWWSVLGFVVACWIASVGDAQWGCLVATGFDIMAQCTEPPAIAYANLTLRVNCALDVLSDAAVLSIPIILIWDAKLRTAEKLAFISLFSLTLLTMLVAILRVVGISSAKWANGQVDPSYLWLWSCIETCIGMTVALPPSSCCVSKVRAFKSIKPTPRIQGARRRCGHGPVICRRSGHPCW
ncbi:Putative protein of unknown function [Podospora comata]|uniref:Rhodopsin domain-containing protein n=1 Tax=Podospora comata TaxID=48703 RepID=A0ABY6S8X3_PODCO|nr:Putative protein of unknown function [Podospora comata]